MLRMDGYLLILTPLERIGGTHSIAIMALLLRWDLQ